MSIDQKEYCGDCPNYSACRKAMDNNTFGGCTPPEPKQK